MRRWMTLGLLAASTAITPVIADPVKFAVNSLASDQPGGGKFLDPDLVNAWGITASAGSPFWIGANGTGTSLIYDGLGAKQGLVVTVDADGKIYLDQAGLSYEDFAATFPAFVRTKRPTGVYLRADGRVAYARVVQVLAVIRGSGVQDVGLVAEPETINR